MSKIRKAVIPVAGLGTRFFPVTKSVSKAMLPLIDKPLIHYVVQECFEAGIEDIIFIVNKRNQDLISYYTPEFELEDALLKNKKFDALHAIQDCTVNAQYIHQNEAKGLGHAIWLAKDAVGDEPFAVLLPDDAFYTEGSGVLKQMVDAIAGVDKLSVMAIEEVKEENVHKYGVIEPKNEPQDGLIPIRSVVEKPTQEEAPSRLAVMGRYILQLEIWEELDFVVEHTKSGEIQLTHAIERLLNKANVMGVQYEGQRFDCGHKEGFVMATLAFALSDSDMGDKVRAYLKACI